MVSSIVREIARWKSLRNFSELYCKRKEIEVIKNKETRQVKKFKQFNKIQFFEKTFAN